MSNTSVPVFFFNDTATTEIYTLSLHDALPIYQIVVSRRELIVTGNRFFVFYFDVCRNI